MTCAHLPYSTLLEPRDLLALTVLYFAPAADLADFARVRALLGLTHGPDVFSEPDGSAQKQQRYKNQHDVASRHAKLVITSTKQVNIIFEYNALFSQRVANRSLFVIRQP